MAGRWGVVVSAGRAILRQHLLKVIAFEGITKGLTSHQVNYGFIGDYPVSMI